MTTTGTPPRVSVRPAVRRLINGVVYVAVVILIWWVYVTVARVPVFLLPPPEAVWRALVDLTVSGELWVHLGYTVRNILIGFVGGVVIGCTLGYLLWRWRLVREIAAPYIVILQAAPKIAIAPLLVLWFGLGLESQLALILLLTFFPMMIAMQLGLSSVESSVRDLARLLAIGKFRYFTSVQLPASMPELFSGAKIAIIDAMTGAFLAEYISAQEGLGYLMVLANSSYRTPLLIAAVLVTVLTGLAGFGAVSIAEKRVLRWRGTR